MFHRELAGAFSISELTLLSGARNFKAIDREWRWGMDGRGNARIIKENVTAYLFILPQLIFFGLFLVYPVIEGFRLSLFEVSFFDERYSAGWIIIVHFLLILFFIKRRQIL